MLIDLLPSILLGCIIGTYLDLYFVGINMYSFPGRPIPNIFTINLLFTLCGLPLQIILFMLVAKRLRWLGKISLVLLFSMFAFLFEMLAELFGFFVHSEMFKHVYTLIGYTLFLTFLLFFYSITTKKQG